MHGRARDAETSASTRCTRMRGGGHVPPECPPELSAPDAGSAVPSPENVDICVDGDGGSDGSANRTRPASRGARVEAGKGGSVPPLGLATSASAAPSSSDSEPRWLAL
eukprot:c53355_g1_i1.p6 GENE.c53355_g1_i1~~c53355_g1_i1.p6  ORF type:complete len:108 (-),score=7.96 c53355_g1_i1:287-610(-)